MTREPLWQTRLFGRGNSKSSCRRGVRPPHSLPPPPPPLTPPSLSLSLSLLSLSLVITTWVKFTLRRGNARDGWRLTINGVVRLACWVITMGETLTWLMTWRAWPTTSPIAAVKDRGIPPWSLSNLCNIKLKLPAMPCPCPESSAIAVVSPGQLNRSCAARTSGDAIFFYSLDSARRPFFLIAEQTI